MPQPIAHFSFSVVKFNLKQTEMVNVKVAAIVLLSAVCFASGMLDPDDDIRQTQPVYMMLSNCLWDYLLLHFVTISWRFQKCMQKVCDAKLETLRKLDIDRTCSTVMWSTRHSISTRQTVNFIR